MQDITCNTHQPSCPQSLDAWLLALVTHTPPPSRAGAAMPDAADTAAAVVLEPGRKHCQCLVQDTVNAEVRADKAGQNVWERWRQRRQQRRQHRGAHTLRPHQFRAMCCKSNQLRVLHRAAQPACVCREPCAGPPPVGRAAHLLNGAVYSCSLSATSTERLRKMARLPPLRWRQASLALAPSYSNRPRIGLAIAG